MDFRVQTEAYRYGARVTALIMQDHQLLAYRYKDQHHLVGGAIEVGEASQDAVIREVKEELGLDCQLGSLMFVAENRFRHEGELHHMIEFHYQVRLIGQAPDRILDGEPYICEWLPLQALQDYDLRPRFLKTALPDWTGKVTHIVLDASQDPS